MYVVAAQHYVKEGKDDEIAAILKKMIPISRAEPGCALYIVNRSVEDPRTILLYEQYHDKSGYEAHMTTEAFKENILGKIVPMLEEASAAFATTPTMRSPASSKVWSTRPMGSSPEKICAPALR